ncbi:hypothetical protein GGQ80_003613 [Sphingomonas jinjuensis]|uniref:Uncharacterized protein n=1 Tax=Sphingomonas jinjuensis TaxID=535907 RepID=A0A840FP72_9SPHN|nr:hypothetical protein [Sphingomonas jinjuensis]
MDLYNGVQAACDPANEWTEEHEWTGLANWSFHQALWTIAEQATEERDVGRDEVTFEMFDDCMRSNLAANCWVAERRKYEDSPPSFH